MLMYRTVLMHDLLHPEDPPVRCTYAVDEEDTELLARFEDWYDLVGHDGLTDDEYTAILVKWVALALTETRDHDLWLSFQ